MKKVLALVVVSGLSLAGCFQQADEGTEATGSTEQAATATSSRFPYAVFSAVDIDSLQFSKGAVRPVANSARVVVPSSQLAKSSPYNAKAAAVQSKLVAMSAKLTMVSCFDSAQQAWTWCARTPTTKSFTAAGFASTYSARAKSIPKGAHPTSQDVPIFQESATGKLWTFTIHHAASNTTASTEDYASLSGSSLLGWYCQASGKNNDLTISADVHAFFPGTEKASAGMGDVTGARGDACLDTGDWLENAASGEWETIGVTALEY